MSIKSVAQLDREVIMTYLVNRWSRSFLATVDGAAAVPDPGYGIDELCPVLYFGQPFDPSKPKDVADITSYAVKELRGYGYYTLDITGGTWNGQQLPLNLIDVEQPNGTIVHEWSLETGTGPVKVTPNATVKPGATAVPFDAEGHPSFTADVTASYLHGVGFAVVNISEMQVEGIDVGSRGSQMAKILVRITYFAAPPSAPLVPEQYAAAAATLFRGVMWVADSSLAEGDLRKDMADSGVSIIRHYRRRDPIQERPNRISERSGWVLFVQQFVVRRQYRLSVRGPQAPTTP